MFCSIFELQVNVKYCNLFNFIGFHNVWRTRIKSWISQLLIFQWKYWCFWTCKSDEKRKCQYFVRRVTKNRGHIPAHTGSTWAQIGVCSKYWYFIGNMCKTKYAWNSYIQKWWNSIRRVTKNARHTSAHPRHTSAHPRHTFAHRRREAMWTLWILLTTLRTLIAERY